MSLHLKWSFLNFDRIVHVYKVHPLKGTQDTFKDISGYVWCEAIYIQKPHSTLEINVYLNCFLGNLGKTICVYATLLIGIR